ncbi:hypothetical protein SASPL_139192 [Salvia splendens]|uniref:Uncharacterized protein n=1 Tax=Salvia splendens TaxID=180675 RepID=A0A8X8ZFR5_SALSN|nr:hypothetical protein SASPL_139192 [Salvia splendens]
MIASFGCRLIDFIALTRYKDYSSGYRALMDLEKEVAVAAENINTRRGLVLAGIAAVAASSVAKAATTDTYGSL